mmetsp:Transcript_1295/g.3523  ORF Transcript_1295/g.3523 Transcript_1295/m.3523 type:complete len:126 (-) Transcript_1295:1230-1607(-)
MLTENDALDSLSTYYHVRHEGRIKVNHAATSVTSCRGVKIASKLIPSASISSPTTGVASPRASDINSQGTPNADFSSLIGLGLPGTSGKRSSMTGPRISRQSGFILKMPNADPSSPLLSGETKVQ